MKENAESYSSLAIDPANGDLRHDAFTNEAWLEAKAALDEFPQVRRVDGAAFVGSKQGQFPGISELWDED